MLGFLKRLLGKKQGEDIREVNQHPEREWQSWKPAGGPADAPEGFVKLSGATEVSIAGTSFRLSDCKTFLSALKGKRADASSIRISCEHVSDEHPNALAVYGVLDHRDVHLGYLPSDISDMLATKYPKDMPLRAAFREWGVKKSGEAVFFKITVFIPNAKARRSIGADKA